MADISDQDMPVRVMEMLRIFLAASSRGEDAALVLETRKGVLTTKYRSVENVAGVPASTINISKKKINPARARRSKARLEEFVKKKVTEKNAVGDITPSSSNRLILELAKPKDKPVETRLASPILQLDGATNVEVNQVEDTTIMFFSFKSKHSEEDIINSLREILPDDGVTSTTLVLRDRLRDHSPDHACTLKVQSAIKNFCWPQMKSSLVDVFREIKRI